MIEIQGVLQHSNSKLCVVPKYQQVVNNSVVMLTAKCSESFARFRSLTDGSFQHIDSGMCLGPRGGCIKSSRDAELVLLDLCGIEETEFSFTEKGSLMHVMSKTCARPSSYPVTNEDTSMIVLNSLCDTPRDKFEFVTVPMPTPTSLPGIGNCGRPTLSKAALVIGGVNAKPGAWPWQAALTRDGRFICGGSLINKNWVVTAAHRINTRISARRYKVILGEHDRGHGEGTEQTIMVKRYVRHPSYNKPYPINNDIALLQLDTPARITSRVNTVCLPPQNYKVPPIISTCYITGWGKIRHPGNSHPILQQGEMPPISNAVCHEKLKKQQGGSSLTITENMLCAGKEDNDISGCHGDSGGPYVCKDKSGRWFLQGIVSWGSTRCRISEIYTVFARAARFRTWIDKEILEVSA
ncbi:chymotrypsin-like protease CTRL-1 isoform X2 [Dendronephthya gigantea]|uniref:chymotrypsin-like protease CTRL-1 isoform X2 n=1 Tax=Dendronephthya gigantea TaxID=151771 RepID=UPI00106AB0EB|nr:chymotrypsin-like protease CTRL-1 isoform X2 [Dendronephthya gigantea]